MVGFYVYWWQLYYAWGVFTSYRETHGSLDHGRMSSILSYLIGGTLGTYWGILKESKK